MDEVKPFYVQDVPIKFNIINSHTLYKVKENYNGLLLLKVRISPHVSFDNLKNLHKKYFPIFPPTEVRIVE